MSACLSVCLDIRPTNIKQCIYYPPLKMRKTPNFRPASLHMRDLWPDSTTDHHPTFSYPLLHFSLKMRERRTLQLCTPSFSPPTRGQSPVLVRERKWGSGRETVGEWELDSQTERKTAQVTERTLNREGIVIPAWPAQSIASCLIRLMLLLLVSCCW